jgi:hypothetical protein
MQFSLQGKHLFGFTNLFPMMAYERNGEKDKYLPILYTRDNA